MGNRILVRQDDGILAAQRRLQEIGRIRTGWSEPYMKDGRELRRPVRSKTIVLTAKTRECLDAAAEVWAGTVERWQPQGNNPDVWRLVTEQDAIDAILPPGDPLNQTMEMWSGGGCTRRCDGVTEQVSTKPCLCLAQFGADFHQQKPVRGVPQVCRPTSRLNVFLDLPLLGTWRIETHSYYAMLEMAAVIDLIKARVGPDPSIPVRLRIDPRTRLVDGKHSPYPVIVVELQGRGVVAQILSGTVDGLAIAPPDRRVAIEAQPVAAPAALAAEEVDGELAADAGLDGLALEVAQALAAIQRAATVPDLRDVWRATDGLRGQLRADQLKGFTDRFWGRKRQIESGDEPEPDAPAASSESAAPVVDAEQEPDRVTVWMKIMEIASQRGWTKEQAAAQMVKDVGKGPKDADGWTMDQFLTTLGGKPA